MDLKKLQRELDGTAHEPELTVEARVETVLRAVLTAAAGIDPDLQGQIPTLARIALGGDPDGGPVATSVVWGH